jgi:hypothetical protein
MEFSLLWEERQPLIAALDPVKWLDILFLLSGLPENQY